MDHAIDKAEHVPSDVAKLNSDAANSQHDGRRAKGVRRRQAILEAARELFLEKGYRKTTLSDIIKKAGGSRETIYSMFQGKLGLFEAIISEWGDQSAEFVLRSTSQAAPPREFLIALGERLMRIWLSPEGRESHLTVLSEGISSPEIVKTWYRGGSEKVLGALTQYIEAQVEDGQLEVKDPLVFARQFQFLLYGEIAGPLIAGDDGPIKVELAVARTVDLLLQSAQPAK